MVRENNGLVHLEELAEHYSVILPDTSVVNETFHMSSDSSDLKERRKALIEQVYLGNTFMRKIDGLPNIFFTSEILKEIGNFNSGTIHNGEKILRRQYGENVSLIMRASRKLFKSRQRLVEYIQREGRVIDLNPDEIQAVEKYREYYGFLMNRYKLSEPDLNLLMSELVASQTRGSCAVLSHDIGIHISWRSILHSEEGLTSPSEQQFGKEEITPGNFGLFIRVKPDGFEEQNCKGFRTYF